MDGDSVGFALHQGDSVVRGTASSQAAKLATAWKDVQNATGQLICKHAVPEKQWCIPSGKLSLDRNASPANH
jgi:hypothetical protein